MFVTTMSGTERDNFEAEVSASGKVSFENIRAKLLVRVLADDARNRLFQDADAEALGNKSAKVLDRLFAKAQAANGLTKKDVDALEKN